MKHYSSNGLRYILFTGLLSFFSAFCYSQNPDCDSGVPYFLVDLTGSPAGSWTSPNIARNEQCCGAPSSDACISFDVILDSGAVGIQIDMTGADPSGSLFYSIGCIGNYPGGTVKCITGPGPHRITFCKPGNNTNTYTITSISQPNFPDGQHVRIGCTSQLITMGITSSTTNWQSVYPGAPGAYNSYLSCTNCASPNYTPSTSAPAYIDYYVCGFPIATACGYNVTVCDTVRIYNDPQLSGIVSPGSAVFCNTGPGSGVTLTASGIGGLPPYSYTWRDISNMVVGTGTTYFANTAGNYTVEISDSLNSTTCPSYYYTVIVSEGQLPVADAGADQTVCPASPTVNLTGTMQYATGGIWSGGSGTFSPGNTYLNTSYTPTAAELAAGSVTLSLTSTGAGGGCTNSTDQMIITFSAPINITIPSASLNCYNSSTTLTANVSGGTAPFSYLWNNGATTSSIFTGQGNYTVVVTDAIGCTGTQSYNLNAPSALSISATGSDATCNGANNGSANALVTGGTSPYSYIWSTSPLQTTAAASGLGAATYTVNITDANGCTGAGVITINEPAPLFAIAAASSDYNGFNVKCNGSGDGTIDMTTTGGTTPYQFLWSNGSTDEDPSGLTAGINTASIIDANGCSTTVSVMLSEPDAVSASVNMTSNYNGFGVSCFSSSDGSIDVNVTGGTNSYTYAWSNGSASQDLSGLSSGTYFLTVTDENNCIDTMTAILTQPAELIITVDGISNYNGYNVSCFNSSDGYILLTTTGGAIPYTYLWDNGATTEDLNSITEGVYFNTITDANNCIAFYGATLIQPALLASATIPLAFGDYNVTCNGSTDGAIDLLVSGGAVPYNYLWSTSANTQDITGLGAGTYSVSIVDLNGCTISDSAIIIQPDLLVASIDSISNFNGFSVSCSGSSNGSIDATVSGGMAPYNYSWSNGAATEDLLLLGAGNYTLVVTDANNCNATLSGSITEPAPLVALIDSLSNYNGYGVSCNLSSDGSINTSVSGGVSPYTYLWNNGASTDDISGLTADSYVLGIEDQNGCLASVNASLSEPAAFTPSYALTNPGCNGLANGSIDFSLNGGVLPYAFNWNNGATTEDLTNIPTGTFSLIFNDINGCTDTAFVILTEPLGLDNSIAQRDILCYGGNNGMIDINIAGGTLPYSYSWSNGANTEDIDSLTQGTYYVTITDAQGCSRTDTIQISQPDPLVLNLNSPVLPNSFNVSFYQGNDGAINASVLGGVEPYSYNWSTNQSSEDLNDLTAGQYSVVVTDENGCAVVGEIRLVEPFNLAMPTGITPNGDGQNDLFTVKGIEAYPDNLLTIYNRWGNVVYKRENYLNEWRGTNTSDEQLPEGTYFAILEINGRDIVLNGYVEIRRK